jgi:hypothetical protein
MKTLNFLNDFWQKAKKAVDEIEQDLPKVQKEDILKPIGTSGKMWTIQFKDLSYMQEEKMKDGTVRKTLVSDWSVKGNLQRHNGESNNLTLLCQKVKDVFSKSPDKVVEFLKATAERGYFMDKLTNERTSLKPNELTKLRLYISENI